MLLANRPMLACCGPIYSFCDPDAHDVASMPAAALRELALVACLLPGLVVDLRAERTPSVTASDGAESYGYGGAMAKCDPIVARSLAGHARHFPHAFYLADAELKSEHAGADVCAENVHRVPLRYSDFRSTFSVKAST